ncbi:TATA-box-binding protein-like [Miscanthus floridulus]|uniref:TATA-box-binding protein-like n=1 Tax=Miscanthus floridulus TaxID=154761 RepID=UPI0034577674
MTVGGVTSVQSTSEHCSRLRRRRRDGKLRDVDGVAARGFATRVRAMQDFKIQSIVGSCDVKFPIRLEGLALSSGTFANYEPEIFPGLVCYMVEPKIVILVFVSGKIILTRAKASDDIHSSCTRSKRMLSL